MNKNFPEEGSSHKMEAKAIRWHEGLAALKNSLKDLPGTSSNERVADRRTAPGRDSHRHLKEK